MSESKSQNLKEYSYGIEFGAMDDYSQYPGLTDKLHSIHVRMNKKGANLKKIILEIKELLSDYTDVLALHNYLYGAYLMTKDYQKAQEVNEWLIAEHPEYSLGPINKAAYALMTEQYEDVEEILGPMLEIGELYPDRKSFHISEIMGFNRVVIKYACEIDDLELAENRLEFLKGIAPDFQGLEEMEQMVMMARFNRVPDTLSNWRNSNANYNEIAPDHLTLPQTTDLPVFNHSEVRKLYSLSLKPQSGSMQEILALPRETLVRDLEEVLRDSIRRYVYIAADNKADDSNAPIHALTLLGYLRATEALPTALEVLRQGDNYIDYSFGDYLSEELWEVYYRLFDLNAFVAYLKEPRLNTFARSPITTALEQKRLHGELPHEEAVNAYTSLLRHFIDHKDDTDLIDGELIGFLICDMMGSDMHDMLPIIKECFDHGIVDEFVAGDYDAVVKDFDEVRTYRKHIFKLNDTIDKFYEEIFAPQPDKNDRPQNYISPKEYIAIKQAENKDIGRNDPCPCGSGKKYKKCCIDVL